MLRSRVGVAVHRNKLYAFGGYNGTERLSTVEVYDPCLRAWNKIGPMQCKRRYKRKKLKKNVTLIVNDESSMKY